MPRDFVDTVEFLAKALADVQAALPDDMFQREDLERFALQHLDLDASGMTYLFSVVADNATDPIKLSQFVVTWWWGAQTAINVQNERASK